MSYTRDYSAKSCRAHVMVEIDNGTLFFKKLHQVTKF